MGILALLVRPLEVHGGKLSIKYFNDAPIFKTVLGGIFIMGKARFHDHIGLGDVDLIEMKLVTHLWNFVKQN